MSLEGELEYEFVAEHDAEEYFGEFDGLEDADFQALGIEPDSPTGAKPGSEEKVLMLAARYAAGLPLWHTQDCYDHGPGGSAPVSVDALVEFGAREGAEEGDESV